MTALDELKFNLREEVNPYFSEFELQMLLDRHKIGEDEVGNPIYDINAATYEGLLVKAEDDSIKLPGLDIPSSQKYYIRLAKRYRTSNTKTIMRADDL